MSPKWRAMLGVSLGVTTLIRPIVAREAIQFTIDPKD